jgi:hypothetical protein
VVRNGQRLSADQAGAQQEGDSIEEVSVGPLPLTVRALIDYPVQVPVLFTIETGSPPWSVWDICNAFADQYARIYERAEVWFNKDVKQSAALWRPE